MENKVYPPQLNSKFLKHIFLRFHCLSSLRLSQKKRKTELCTLSFIILFSRFTQNSSSFNLPVSSTSLRTAAFSWKESTFLRFRDLMNVHHLYSPLLFSCIQTIITKKRVIKQSKLSTKSETKNKTEPFSACR